MLTCSITSLSGFPTFCNTVSANENSGGDCAVSLIVDAADVAVSGVLVLSFLLFCSFSPVWPFGRTRNWFEKTTCNFGMTKENQHKSEQNQWMKKKIRNKITNIIRLPFRWIEMRKKKKKEQMDSLIEKMMAVSGIFKWEHFTRKKNQPNWHRKEMSGIWIFNSMLYRVHWAEVCVCFFYCRLKQTNYSKIYQLWPEPYIQLILNSNDR